MRVPGSLQRRLGLSLGVLLTGLWIGAASVTAVLARNAIEEIFDSALQERRSESCRWQSQTFLGVKKKG